MSFIISLLQFGIFIIFAVILCQIILYYSIMSKQKKNNESNDINENKEDNDPIRKL